jgi:hypothetical protein
MFKKNHLSTKKTGVRSIAKGKSKFGNQKSIHEGIKFDSSLEYEIYQTLRALEGTLIKKVEAHPEAILLLDAQYDMVGGKRVCIHKQLTFNPDFKIILCDDRVFYLDAKSWATLCAAYMIKVKLLSKFHGFQCYTVFREHARDIPRVIKEITNNTYIQTYSRSTTLKKGYK